MRKTIVATVAAIVLVGLTTGFTVSSVDLPDWLPAAAPGGGNVDFENPTVASGATFRSAWLPVAAFTQLLVQFGAQTNGQSANIQVNWAQDAAGAKTLQYFQSWHKNGNSLTNVVLPVQGPYVQFVYTNTGVLTATLTLNVQGLATPFLVSPVVVTGVSVWLSQQGITVAGGGIVAPNIQGPGRLRVWLEDNATANNSVAFQRWDGGAWVYFAVANLGAVGAPYVNDIVMPFDDWRILVTSASTAFYAAAVAS